MHTLICADAIRPSLTWRMANSSRFARPAIQHSRDPEGFARLEAAGCPGDGNVGTASAALLAIAQMIAAYGGTVQDITVGDCLALLQASVGRKAGTNCIHSMKSRASVRVARSHFRSRAHRNRHQRSRSFPRGLGFRVRRRSPGWPHR